MNRWSLADPHPLGSIPFILFSRFWDRLGLSRCLYSTKNLCFRQCVNLYIQYENIDVFQDVVLFMVLCGAAYLLSLSSIKMLLNVQAMRNPS